VESNVLLDVRMRELLIENAGVMVEELVAAFAEAPGPPPGTRTARPWCGATSAKLTPSSTPP
jgi:hypothetical protein